MAVLPSADIHDLFRERAKTMASEHSEMRTFEDFITGKGGVHLAIQGLPDRVVANHAANGLRQLGLRAGSVVPNQFWPALREGFKEHEERARTRKRWGVGLWEQNDYQGVLTLRAQHLFAHAYAPVTVLPRPLGNGEWSNVPEWRIREPVCTLPAPCSNPLEVQPPDTFFAYRQSWAWLRRTYGDVVLQLKRPKDTKPDTQFLFLEFISDRQITHLAASDVMGEGFAYDGVTPFVELAFLDNRAERPLAFVPSIYGLGGRYRQFAGSQGIDLMRSRILGLAYIAAQKGADPATYIEDQNGEGDLIAPYNPVTGDPGLVQGQIKTIQVQPSVASLQMLSILEREMRQAGGIPAAFGAEAASTVQTGRMASDLTSTAIDYPIMAAQQRFEVSAKAELEAAPEIVKGWGSTRRQFYVNWKGAKGYVDLDPKTDLDSTCVVVKYPQIGTDLNNANLRGEAKVSTRLWSRQTFREMDPETEDAEKEEDRVTGEALMDAFMASVNQKVVDPTSRWGPAQVGKLRQLIVTNKKDLFEAVAEIEAEMLADAEEAAPVPDALPGAPGAVETPPAGPPDLAGLSSVLGQLRGSAPEAA